MPTLFDPLKAGALTLPNRILMAPLTEAALRLKAACPQPCRRNITASARRPG